MLQQWTRSVICFAAGLASGSLFIASPQATHSQALPQTSAVPSSEIAVLRYIRIKKNSYPEIYRQSVENVWPYYEKAVQGL